MGGKIVKKVPIQTNNLHFFISLFNRGCSETLKDSLANALRHSRRQAESTYDKRTYVEKKKEALSFARNEAEALSSSDDEQQNVAKLNSVSSTFKSGDFVAVVHEDSTLNRPNISLGRIFSFQNDKEVLLSWYKKVSHGNYKLSFDADCWIEHIDNIVHVNVNPAKGTDTFKLEQSIRSIHKLAFNDK